MSATALLDAPRPVGRPSNAELTLRSHVLAGEVERLTEDRDDLVVELSAYATERLVSASQTVALARAGQRAIAAGHNPTQMLLDLERIGLRDQLRALAMGLAPEPVETTDDEQDEATA